MVVVLRLPLFRLFLPLALLLLFLALLLVVAGLPFFMPLLVVALAVSHARFLLARLLLLLVHSFLLPVARATLQTTLPH